VEPSILNRIGQSPVSPLEVTWPQVWECDWYENSPDAPQNEPQALILSYPVITSGPVQNTQVRLTTSWGPNPSAEILEESVAWTGR